MFDIHHHWERKKGIYNWRFDELLPTNYFSAGLHPKDIDSFEENWAKIREISQSPNCVAIGECGLDGLINIDETRQEKIFETQILWANEIQKPVIVHCVRRFSQLLRFAKTAQVPMIIHGFHKKKSIATALLEKDFYLSFGKAILYDENLQNIAKEIPLDKVFLETDTADIRVDEVYHQFAEIKKIDLDILKIQIAENIERVFSIQLKL